MYELKRMLEELQRDASVILTKYDCFCLIVRNVRTWDRDCSCFACEAEKHYQFCARELKKLSAQI